MEEKKSFFIKIKEKITKKRAIGVVAVIAVAVVVLPVLSRRGEMQQASGFEKVGTRTTILRRTSLNDSVTVTGTVESTQTVNVTCTVSGYTVSEILVQEGDHVTEGDVIARLDTTDILESINKTKEKLDDNVRSAQTTYNQAETDKNKAYDRCIAQETVLNNAKEAETEAQRRFEIAKQAVATQQSAYDSAVKAENMANDYNNQHITLMNEASSIKESAKSAVVKAEKAVAEAQTAYDKAVTDGTDDTAVLKAAFETAQSRLTTALAAYDAAAAEYDSAYRMVYDGSVGTQAKYDAAKQKTADALQALNDAKTQTNYTILENEYNNAVRDRTSARTTLDNLQKTYTNALSSFEKAEESLANASTSDELEELYEKYNNCTINANATGTVTQVNTTVGSVANGTIAVIQDTENLKISTSFAEYDVQNIEIGMRCVITSDANDKTLSGYVSQISPTAAGGNMGSSDVSFAGEVTINGTDHGLLIGMNAQAEVIITQVSDVYVVPYDAVGTNEDGENVVYVQNGEEFNPVVVQTGMETDYYIEISSDELQDGMIIRSSANEDESGSVVFTEDGEITESGFMVGGFGGGTGNVTYVAPAGGMPSGGGGGNMPDRGGMGGRG